MFKLLTSLCVALSVIVCADNQTPDATLSLLQSPDSLPFNISIELADFSLPAGIQSFAFAVYKDKWLFISGRTSGLHGFDNNTENFPPRTQNTVVYVVDPQKKKVYSRSLADPSSGLTQAQIDTLSATNVEFHQVTSTLYVVGGYGVDTATGQFSTKPVLTAINIPGLMHWVEKPKSKGSAAQYIRQTTHPLMQVTGGFLTQENPHQPFLLIFGQNFTGFYTEFSNGVYSQQVRPFNIVDNGRDLYVQPLKQHAQNPNYRRRDLNVLPIIQKTAKTYTQAFVALSGVFTPTEGVWTVPVLINADGTSHMPDPSLPGTLKQSVNNYDCARTSLFSKKTNSDYILLFGGISYLGADFLPNPEEPFTNTVTTVQIDSHGNFQQYLMNSTYPYISTAGFPAPTSPNLLFGAEARFLPAKNLPTFPNEVFSLDHLDSPVLLGYIVGGIASSCSNTFTQADSVASPYIFKVMIYPQ